MPELYTWAILLITQQDEIGEKQLSGFGTRGGQNSLLMHVPLSYIFINLKKSFYHCFQYNLYMLQVSVIINFGYILLSAFL